MSTQFQYPLTFKKTSIAIAAALLAVAVGVFLPIYFAQSESSIFQVTFIYAILGSIGLFFAFWAYYYFKWRFVITSDRITKISIYDRRTLLLGEIKGCAPGNGNRSILFIPHDTTKEQIEITMGSVDNHEILIRWIKENCQDLQLEMLKKERNDFDNDTSWGGDEDDRKRKLDLSYTITRTINIFSVIAFFLAPLLLDKQWSFIFLMLVIMASLTTVRQFNGKIALLKQSASIYPDLSIAFIVSNLASFIILISTIDRIIEWPPFFLPFMLVFIFFVALSFFCLKNSVHTKNKITVLLFAAGYSFLITIAGNILFDSSTANCCSSSILKKVDSAGRSKSCTLTVEPCTPNNLVTEVETHHELCQQKNSGDKIDVCVKKGLLGIPWYFAR